MVGPERNRYATKVRAHDRRRGRGRRTHGLSTVWIPQVPDEFDAMTAAALIAQATSRIEIGTAVVPVAAAPPGRAGPAVAVDPARRRGPVHARPRRRRTTGSSRTCSACPTNARRRSTADYLDVLDAAMAGPGPVDVENDTLPIHNPMDVTDEPPHAGPARRARAGDAQARRVERTDGTILWLADEKAIESHVAPRLTRGRRGAADRRRASWPACRSASACRRRGRRGHGPRRTASSARPTVSPNYQRLLDQGDATGVADILAAGDEDDDPQAPGARSPTAGVTDISRPRPADRRRPRRAPRVEPAHPRVRRPLAATCRRPDRLAIVGAFAERCSHLREMHVIRTILRPHPQQELNPPRTPARDPMTTPSGISIFDADNHFYETPDALTKSPARPATERGIEYVEVRDGRTKIAVGGKISEYIPNPTFDVVARPGAQEEYFRNGNPDGKSRRELFGEPIKSPPAFREPASRLELMDEQGIDRTLMFPTLASLIEERMQRRSRLPPRRHPRPQRVDVRDVAVRLRGPHLLHAGHHAADRREGDRGARVGRTSAAPRSCSSVPRRCPASAAPARSPCPSSTRSGSGSSSPTSSSRMHSSDSGYDRYAN